MDPSAMRYIGQLALAQMDQYYQPLVDKLREQEVAIKTRGIRNVHELTVCRSCFILTDIYKQCKSCYDPVCRFCITDSGCPKCSVPCAARKCQKRVLKGKANTCNTCNSLVCDDHVQYCPDCGCLLCLEKEACTDTHRCPKLHKREKRQRVNPASSPCPPLRGGQGEGEEKKNKDL
jgi:hypothetical protein